MELTKNIQIILKEDDFCDALYYPVDAVPTTKIIQQQAQARIDNYKEMLANPPVEIPVDLQVQKDSIDEQIIQLQTQKAEIVMKMAVSVKTILEK